MLSKIYLLGHNVSFVIKNKTCKFKKKSLNMSQKNYSKNFIVSLSRLCDWQGQDASWICNERTAQYGDFGACSYRNYMHLF